MTSVRNSFYILFIFIAISSQSVFSADKDMRLGGPVEITTEVLPFGYQDDDYSTRIYISGGSGEYFFHPTALPEGLILKESGRLEGVIKARTGDHSVRIVASDTLDETKLYEKILTLTVFKKMTFRDEPITAAVKGTPYKQQIRISGGSGKNRYEIQNFPDGLTIDDSGIISGVPTGSPGERNVKIIVYDTELKDKKIIREELFQFYPKLVIRTEKLPEIQRGQEVSTRIIAEGGSGYYRCSAKNLPKGLMLNPSGVISGITRQPRGLYHFSVSVTDPNTLVSAEKQHTIPLVDFLPDDYEIEKDNSLETKNSLPPGIENNQLHTFNQPGDSDYIRLDLTAVRPEDVIHLSVIKESPDVKPILTLFSPEKKVLKKTAVTNDKKTADLYYRCKTPGIYYAGITEASGETGKYTISLVNKGTGVSFVKDTLPDVLKKSNLSIILKAMNGSGAYRFTATGLPKGIELTQKGILKGTAGFPSGDYPFKVTVSDTRWTGISESGIFNLHVVDFFPDRYEFSDDDDFLTHNRLFPGSAIQYHTFNTKGDKDYVKLDLSKVQTGNIIDIQVTRSTVTTKPAITLFGADKSEILSSKPNENDPRLLFECAKPGIYYLLIHEATGNVGDYNLSAVNAGPKVKFANQKIPDILKKANSRFQLKAVYGSGSFHFSSDNLPGRLKLSKTGMLSVKNDTGLERGEYQFSVKVSDLTYPGIFAEKKLSIRIVDFFPDSFEVNGDDTFDTSNIIKPGNIFQYHTFNEVGDIDFIRLDLSEMKKNNVLSISTSVNTPSSQTALALFDQNKKIIRQVVTSGQLKPAELYFRCSTPGLYTLKISEPENKTGDYGLNIKDVGPAPVITTDSFPDLLTGKPFSKRISVSGGSGEYFFSSTGLPEELSINHSGVISGRLPSKSGKYSFTLSVEDKKYHDITTRKKLILNIVDFFPDVFEKAGDNNYFTTNKITPGEKKQHHTFNFKGDADYTAIDLSGCRPNDLIKIRTGKLTRQTGTVLSFYDAEYKKIKTEPAGKARGYSQMMFLCENPAIYYLKAVEVENDVGDYFLEVINTGQQLRINTESIPDILKGQPYRSGIAVEGGCGRFRLSVKNLPEKLAVSNKGVITGSTDVKSNKTYRFTVSAYDVAHPENKTQQIISAKVVDYYPDPYEKNNDNDFSTTNTLTSGKSQKHNFNYPGDKDFIRLDLSSAKPDDVIIIKSSSLSKNTVTDVVLYDNRHQLIAENKKNHSKIVFNSTKPAIYFLKITSATNRTGAYAISMHNSGQPVTLTNPSLALAESAASYKDVLKTTGGCGKYNFTITSGKLPDGLSLNPKTGTITGRNRNWGAYRFTVTAKDLKHSENMGSKTYLIDAYVGKKLRGTQSVMYPFYIGETLNAEGFYNTISALPGLIRGGIKKHLRYRIIRHNIPEKRFEFRFNTKTAELFLKEPATVTCDQYRNLDISVSVEVYDTINKNNKLNFSYEIPVKCLAY